MGSRKRNRAAALAKASDPSGRVGRERTPEKRAAVKTRSIRLAALALGLLLLGWILHLLLDRPGPGRRVLFVGLDGADWQLLDRYIAEGRMPRLAELLREGRSGVLQTEQPPLSPLLWTSMMTGLGPLEHGILDFARFHPGTGEREPITSDERRAPAVWNIASAAGREVAVLGLWATWPAESVRGLLVSERLFSFQTAAAPPPGIVFPPEREAWARDALARAERAEGHAEMALYLPWLGEADYRPLAAPPDPYAHPVSALRRILVETRVYHELAVQALRERRPDLGVVYLQGPDAIGHVFSPYAAPRQASVTVEDFERYRGVPERYFTQIDGLLGEYRELARSSGAVLMLASDHGFRWSEGRPERLSSLAGATAGRWHRDEGMFLLWGPGIQPTGGHGERGGVRQVCATLLALLGLAPGKGMAGPPLGGVPAAELPAVDYGEGYTPAVAAGAAAGGEELEKLQALGYIGSQEPASAPPERPGSTRTAGSYNNEGLIRRAQGDGAGARAAFEQALAIDPKLGSALGNLSELLLDGGGAGGAGVPLSPPADLTRSDELLLRAIAAGLPEGLEKLIGRALQLRRSGQAERAAKLVDAALEVRQEAAELWLLRGRWRLEAQRCTEALGDFRETARLRPSDALAHASAGLASLCLGDEAGAETSLRRSLEIDPNQPELRRFFDGGS